jgi:hypothetical protein
MYKLINDKFWEEFYDTCYPSNVSIYAEANENYKLIIIYFVIHFCPHFD